MNTHLFPGALDRLVGAAQPGLEQLELSHRILLERAHPLFTGEPVCGYSARYDEAHGDLTLTVCVLAARDEIWGPVQITRCFRIKPDCSVTTYHVGGWQSCPSR